MAQTRVSGSVLSADDGEPIIGATIRVVGTSVGAISDADGKFSLSAPQSAKKLEVSYVGYQTQTVNIKPNVTIHMQPGETTLDEFVVLGYGSAKKPGTISGSVKTVTAEKFEHRPIANIGDALQGQVAGVQVYTSSGEPSASVSMRIRGVTSINASTTPLYILDGSEISSTTFRTLNPNDIETMTVLKDASATAIYGSRAANGVVVLTSKKGKYGVAPDITISAQYGFSRMTGDKVTMSGPYGEFRPQYGTGREMIWVGGGAGMAPLRAQIMHMLKGNGVSDEDRKRPMHYFYGARALEEIPFLDDFLALDKEFENFHFHLALDRPDPKADEAGIKYTPGFVAPVMGDTYLKAHEAPEDCEYYLCGPPMMAKTVLDLLHSLGVEDDMIRFDNFGG